MAIRGMCCLRRDIKPYEWRLLGGNISFVRAVANQARKLIATAVEKKYSSSGHKMEREKWYEKEGRSSAMPKRP